jgi:O-antigen ligase
MCASVAWAVYPPLAVVRGWQFLVTAALAAAIAQLGSRLDLHRLAHLYIYVVSASVLFGTQVHFKRQRLLIHRFNWLHVHPVIAGTYLGLGVVLTLWLVLNRKERPGLPSAPLAVYFVALALLAGGLIGTQTRGALGGCAAGCAVLLLITYRTRLLELVAFGAVGAIVVALLFLGTILTFLARGESSQELTSFNGRTPLWSQAYHLFLQSPLIGYGTTASRGLFWENVHLGGAHNAAVNVIVDGGLIALFLWLAILIGMVRLLRPLLHTPAGAIDVPVIGAALAYLFVNGFTTEGLGYVGNVSSIWLFVLVGWLGILARLALPRFPSHQDEVS